MYERLRKTTRSFAAAALVTALAAALFIGVDASLDEPDLKPHRSSYIVKAATLAEAERLVAQANGRVTASLAIINAVGAELTDEQAASIRASENGVSVYADAPIEVSGDVLEADYSRLVGADALHAQGLTGDGVTIAVLDTGLWQSDSIESSAGGNERIVAAYDALPGASGRDDDDDDDDECDDDDCEAGGAAQIDDWNGHGTHITSIIASSARSDSGRYQGVAPNAKIVAVRAFKPNGVGTYRDVIKALDWIVANRERYGIRVLNLSFGAPASSHYWDDPVNQAVMEAWKRGIIVVAAAGNSGPGPMTVGIPANVPYVITVGAMTDSYTPNDRTDDRLARFSAAGPTIEGFVKPDVVAPGGHMLGQMPSYAWLPLQYPQYVQPAGDYFRMSGTSQAAAVVSGVIALMLEADSTLSPNAAKCRIMASARAALLDSGEHAYTVFQQGAGMIDAQAAVNETAANCANQGMNIYLDTWGLRHYAGLAGVDQTGTYYLVDQSGERLAGSQFEWSSGSLHPGGALWPEGALWNQGALWSSGMRWNDVASVNQDSLLSQGALWPEGRRFPATASKLVSTYLWVEQE